jgi:hypothetical protein
MTATIWVDTDRDETIELGPTLPMYKIFSNITRVAGGSKVMQRDYPDLYGVPTATETQDDVPSDWLEDVHSQALEFLNKHGNDDSLEQDSKDLLDTLIEQIEDISNG